MKIRSITVFIDDPLRPGQEQLTDAGAFIAAARPRFEAAGYPVQTVRLATTPFPNWLPSLDPEQVIRLIQELEATVQALGYEYLSLGPADPEHPRSYLLIPEILAATQITFFSGHMTTPGRGLSLAAVRLCAEIIRDASGITPDGFTNLRFAALANVLPGTPFFPAAYHAGSQPAFALATEGADLAVRAFSEAGDLEDARSRLVATVEGHAKTLTQAAGELEGQFSVHFGGIDFTLAPFPEDELSIGTALERLGVPAVGLHGSLAAAAFLAETLDRARFPKTGFSGLMLPVLEDARLSQRAAECTLTVKDLLLYSAVCGSGLDTIPLPGDTTAEEIAAVLLDVAAFALRLDKPLTARLLPIPGKAAGDPTGFDFTYFANSRVMRLEAEPLQNMLAKDEAFVLQSRSG